MTAKNQTPESYLNSDGMKIYVHKGIKQTVTVRNENNRIIYQKVYEDNNNNK